MFMTRTATKKKRQEEEEEAEEEEKGEGGEAGRKGKTHVNYTLSRTGVCDVLITREKSN